MGLSLGEGLVVGRGTAPGQVDPGKITGGQIRDLLKALPPGQKLTTDDIQQVTGKYFLTDDERGEIGKQSVKVDPAAKKNELLVYDKATGTFMGTGVFADDGDIDTAPNSVTVGNHKLSSAGDGFNFINLNRDKVFSPPWQELGETVSDECMVRRYGPLETRTIHPDDGTVITNPSWSDKAKENFIGFSLHLKFSKPMTNVQVTVGAMKENLWESPKFNVAKAGDYALVLDDPMAFRIGERYRIKIKSEDGDVLVMGNSQGVPFWEVKLRTWVEKPLIDGEQMKAAIAAIPKPPTVTPFPGVTVTDGEGVTLPGIKTLHLMDMTLEKVAGQPESVAIHVDFPPAGQTGNTLVLEDGTDSFGGATTLVFEGGKLSQKDPDDPKKITLTLPGGGSAVLWQNLGEASSVRPNKIVVEPPLQMEPDPQNAGGIRFKLKHGEFEPKLPEGFLGYLAYDEEIKGRKVSGDWEEGPVWWDEVAVGEDMFIQQRMDLKAIGIQEDDDGDPNVTGGTMYLVAVRIQLKGVAPEDGRVRVYLKDLKQGVVGVPGYGSVLNDEDGNPMAAVQHVKQGQKYEPMVIVGFVAGKAIDYFQTIVGSTFKGHSIETANWTEGASGILVQALHKGTKVGLALMQWEEELGEQIRFVRKYFGPSVANMAFILGQNQAAATINKGDGFVEEDGWGLENWGKLEIAVAGGMLDVKDVGEITGFGLKYIFDSEDTKSLRGKQLNVFLSLQDKQMGFNVYPITWTGEADAFPDVATGMTNDQLVLNADWRLEPSAVFISEDVVSGIHSAQGAARVPQDAVNYGFMLVPVAVQTPMALQLKMFRIDTARPFYSYILNGLVSKFQAQYRPSEAHFQWGVQPGQVSLRYTINIGETPMPAGKLVEGHAPITQVGGQINNSGEQGHYEIGEDGMLNVKARFYVYPGEKLPVSTTVSFWLAKIVRDGIYDEVADSRVDVPIHKGDQAAFVTVQPFDVQVVKGEKYLWLAKAGGNDFAFIEATNGQKIMEDVWFQFKSLDTKAP